jgi:DinB superfamily
MTETAAVAIPAFAETISAQYQFCNLVVKTNLDGIDDAESRVIPQPGGNPLNWILGHIIMVRQALLVKAGGRPPLLSAESTKAYGRGSTPGDNLPESLPALLALYERSQEEMEAMLARLTEDQLAGPAPFSPAGPEASLATLLQKAVCHEAYHAGQLGIGRRLVGKSGAIA